ncbi:hypothetical protein [Psychrobacter aestuarii]|uniref:Uncharacterized protein n=1 Tax=Psychrobacter aestuarii TaxID=556327 RepID=A0ABP3FBF4_9GAMM|nr:hypothetical protein [Psychrobacter aestuarii]
MIDGTWWLLIIIAVIAVLWLIASKRGDKAATGKTGTPPSNDALQKTAALIEKAFAHYRVTRRANHLLITEQDKKVAMITIDKKIPVGERLLGDVAVINYHSAPSKAELKKILV